MSESQRDKADQTVRSFLRRAQKSVAPVSGDTLLYSEGIGLDSLSTAELSAVLEDELGTDPFSQGELPQTVGEVLDFYGDADDAAALR